MRAAVAAALTTALAWSAPAAADCTISAFKPVVFGSYNVYSSAPLDTTGSFTYSCTLGSQIQVDINGGGSGDINARRMSRTGGGTTLSYQLYRDPTRLLLWGNTATTRMGPILGSIVPVEIFIYARVPAQQDVEVGSYTDSITLTFNY